MLGRFSIKQRMFGILISFFLLFIFLGWVAVRSSHKVKDLALTNTETIMASDQKDKLRVATHSVALTLGHSLSRLASEEEKIAAIRSALDDIRFEADRSGYYFVYRDTVNICLPPQKQLQGKDLKDVKSKQGVYLVRAMRDQAKTGGGFVEYNWSKPGAGEVLKLGYAEMIPGTDYWIGTGIYLDNIEIQTRAMASDIEGQVTDILFRMLGLSGLLFIGIAVLCLSIVFGISRALGHVIHGVRDIAEGEGNLTKRVEILTRDELGELAKWLNLFLEKLHGLIQKLAVETQGVERSSHELTGISENIAGEAGRSAGQSKSVAAASEEMSVSLTSVAAAMEQSSQNAATVASAAEQMHTTISEIAGNAEKTRAISETAAEKAENAGAMMESLREAAASISQVTETITDISNQTNLLALNATIESARAGQAGKGFAVVANEIKALAGQTAAATQNIKTQVENVQGVSEKAVLAIREIMSVMAEAREMVAAIAAAVGEQSAATRDISLNIEQLSSGIREANGNVSQSSAVAVEISGDIATVDEASSALTGSSKTLHEGAVRLREMAGQLKGIVDTFVI